jgi:4-alpha-glucanotransferase
LGFEGDAPAEMDGRVARAVVMQHLQSPAAFALFAWQDLLAMDERLRRDNPDDERVNVPSNRDHCWNYRMHISLEQMLDERAYNEALRGMIAESGRLICK